MKISDILYKISDNTFGRLLKDIQWSGLKQQLEKIDYEKTEGEYLGLVATSTIMATILMIIITIIFSNIIPLPIGVFGTFGVVITIISMGLIYPTLDLYRKIETIENNMPLAILTMSTAIESGAPPQYMFKSISNNPDYPRIGKETAKIETFINKLGMSITEAISETAKSTPSPTLRKFLTELTTSIKSGGDLKVFVEKRAEKAYFEYTLKIEQANKRAETFGDLYTMVLIAAPLFLFSSIMLLGMFGGSEEQTILGLSTELFLTLSIFLVIPAINIAFLIVMTLITPGGS